jgi:hypothetical protein
MALDSMGLVLSSSSPLSPSPHGPEPSLLHPHARPMQDRVHLLLWVSRARDQRTISSSYVGLCLVGDPACGCPTPPTSDRGGWERVLRQHQHDGAQDDAFRKARKEEWPLVQKEALYVSHVYLSIKILC